MTGCAAAPEPLRDSRSLLTPLLIASPVASSRLSVVFHNLEGLVPVTTVVRKVKVGRKAVPTAHARRTIHLRPEGDSYNFLVRCCDCAPDEDLAASLQKWRWEIGIVPLKPAFFADVVPAGHEVVRLDVTRFRLESGGVAAAPQLALFRHLFVEGYLSIDPRTLVLGGQRDWRAEWWPNRASPDSALERR